MVYVTSLTHDRKSFRDSRRLVDFLSTRKPLVPFSVVDLAAQPAQRALLDIPESGQPVLPQLHIIHGHDIAVLSADEIQDLEDHNELGSVLRKSFMDYIGGPYQLN